jgi:hypothetical protein
MKNSNPCQTCPRSGCAYRTEICAPCPTQLSIELIKPGEGEAEQGVSKYLERSPEADI